MKQLLLVAIVAAVSVVSGAFAAERTDAKTRDTWVKQRLLAANAEMLPFGFQYGTTPSATLLAKLPGTTTTRKLDQSRTETLRTWHDAATGLEVRCRAVSYSDFPAVEWTLYLKNTGTSNTQIIDTLQAIDAHMALSADSSNVLHCHRGDYYSADGYAPYDLPLAPGTAHAFAPDGGRPTNGPNGWPYYNVQLGKAGVLLAIGWPGQWAANFKVNSAGTAMRISAGQEKVHLILHPGEEIRSPLIAMLFYSGMDVAASQNAWRRWMLAHNVPRLDGNKTPSPMAQMQLCVGFNDGEDVMFRELKRLDDAHIPIDLCWRDAGWYSHPGDWPNTGTWEVDPVRFPQGFKPISKAIHDSGRKLIVWFEPERVGWKESYLAKNHPEWLLGGHLLNLGNPEARSWLTEHVDGLLKEQGIDFYRQDFNMDPLNDWRSNDDKDAPDRQGISENLHVQGYLAYWDELRRRHPGMLIDSCASGGRRNDLETLRRAVPLLRSDFQFGNGAIVGNQGHTYGISSWIPYYGSGFGFTDMYGARSFYVPCNGFAGPNMEMEKRAYAECREIAPAMLGDYYPLTPYSLAADTWIAWEFYKSDTGEGVVQAFRREAAKERTMNFKLRGLKSTESYEVKDADRGNLGVFTGDDLMLGGIQAVCPTGSSSSLITIRRAEQQKVQRHEAKGRPKVH